MSSACDSPRPSSLYAWIPALIAVGVICVESTNSMGLAHTEAMLKSLVRWTGHTPGGVDPVNRLLRKVGHFSGYGMLGVCFARGWLTWFKQRGSGFWKTIYLRAGVLGATCAAAVASCDELHQRFLPSRHASVEDVLLDTCGAVTFIAAAGLFALRRRATASLPVAELGNGSYSMHGAAAVYSAG